MTKKELLELIRGTIKEYMGTGNFRNPGKGGQNPRRASRVNFDNEEDELDWYTKQNAGEGGEGRHYKNYPATPNLNRTRFTKF
mgnify:CR=1 FL=1|jgi:hypothetical protein|tara:strand:+ start:331 stop:579 length:249 start_codon:yes stop_codon:yes gene_type:complete